MNGASTYLQMEIVVREASLFEMSLVLPRQKKMFLLCLRVKICDLCLRTIRFCKSLVDVVLLLRVPHEATVAANSANSRFEYRISYTFDFGQ